MSRLFSRLLPLLTSSVLLTHRVSAPFDGDGDPFHKKSGAESIIRSMNSAALALFAENCEEEIENRSTKTSIRAKVPARNLFNLRGHDVNYMGHRMMTNVAIHVESSTLSYHRQRIRSGIRFPRRWRILVILVVIKHARITRRCIRESPADGMTQPTRDGSDCENDDTTRCGRRSRFNDLCSTSTCHVRCNPSRRFIHRIP